MADHRCTRSVRCRKAHEPATSESRTLSETIPYFFPEEVKEEILSRLPVKSLLRFSCVCKSWRDLIKSAKFISLHQKNQKPYLLIGNRDRSKKFSPISSFLRSNGNDAALQKVADFELHRSINPSVYNVLSGVCDGIICLHGRHAYNILLWNPATKDVKIIPKNRLRRGTSFSTYNCRVGFGFDPERKDYKILQMVYENDVYCLKLELYSLRADSWKKIECHAIAPMFGTQVCNFPFAENRFLCGIVRRLIKPKGPEVISLDLSSETLETIQLPDGLPDSTCYRLFPFKASIALGIVVDECWNLYVLNGFYSTQRSWSYLFSVKHHIRVWPIACWENLFIFQELRTKNLMLLDNPVDHDDSTLVDLGISGYRGYVTASVYKETLVRLGKIEKKRRFSTRRSTLGRPRRL